MGCSLEEPGDSEPERYARRFLPFNRDWQLESTVPREPQETPQMVIWEVSLYPPGAKPTPEQQRAAEDLIERCERAAVEKDWETFETAEAAGFTMMVRDRRHYLNEEYLLDDVVLDPERPEFLMYYDTPERKRLVGYMFNVADLDARGPQIGGPLTVWHYHVWNHLSCLKAGLFPVGRPPVRGQCRDGLVPAYRSPEMIHVWLIDRRGGSFATSMALDPDRAREQIELRDRTRGRQHGP